MTVLSYQIVIGLLLLALLIVVIVAAGVVGRVPLAGAYAAVKGRWPYILGVTSAAVVELHAQGIITDSQFKTLLALHAAGIGPALRGAIQHIVGDAIQRKVTVQIKEAQAVVPRPSVRVTPTRIEEPVGTPKESDT